MGWRGEKKCPVRCVSPLVNKPDSVWIYPRRDAKRVLAEAARRDGGRVGVERTLEEIALRRQREVTVSRREKTGSVAFYSLCFHFRAFFLNQRLNSEIGKRVCDILGRLAQGVLVRCQDAKSHVEVIYLHLQISGKLPSTGSPPFF